MAQAAKGKSRIGVQKYLRGADYPASKDDLVAKARDNKAPRTVLNFLQRLPGRKYDGPDKVMQAYGKSRLATGRSAKSARSSHGFKRGPR